MAGYYLGAYTQRFPYSPKAQEALFLSAMCSVKNSPEPSLDQNETELAINNLQQFIDTYPESTLVDSCNTIMDKLRLKLELKDYNSVKLYSKTENYRAAATSAITFIEDYPRSGFREEISYLLVRNSYYLTVNSIENKKCERIEQTIERYRTFVAEFPNSNYKTELNGYNEKMDREFEILCSKK
jgi:outer membrane protein assembly factor BamD